MAHEKKLCLVAKQHKKVYSIDILRQIFLKTSLFIKAMFLTLSKEGRDMAFFVCCRFFFCNIYFFLCLSFIFLRLSFYLFVFFLVCLHLFHYICKDKHKDL